MLIKKKICYVVLCYLPKDTAFFFIKFYLKSKYKKHLKKRKIAIKVYIYITCVYIYIYSIYMYLYIYFGIKF